VLFRQAVLIALETINKNSASVSRREKRFLEFRARVMLFLLLFITCVEEGRGTETRELINQFLQHFCNLQNQKRDLRSRDCNLSHSPRWHLNSLPSLIFSGWFSVISGNNTTGSARVHRRVDSLVKTGVPAFLLATPLRAYTLTHSKMGKFQLREIDRCDRSLLTRCAVVSVLQRRRPSFPLISRGNGETIFKSC